MPLGDELSDGIVGGRAVRGRRHGGRIDASRRPGRASGMAADGGLLQFSAG